MVPKLSRRLSEQEFASLLKVGNTAVNGPPAIIPPEHSARLTGLGYMMYLAGRLRLTGPGRLRIAAGFENKRRNDHRLQQRESRPVRKIRSCGNVLRNAELVWRAVNCMAGPGTTFALARCRQP